MKVAGGFLIAILGVGTITISQPTEGRGPRTAQPSKPLTPLRLDCCDQPTSGDGGARLVVQQEASRDSDADMREAVRLYLAVAGRCLTGEGRLVRDSEQAYVALRSFDESRLGPLLMGELEQ